MALDTPNYIKALLVPNGKKPAGKRVWSIDLEAIWLPFFTATNTMGDTAIPSDALGAPVRLGYNQDGSVKFSKTGRPVLKVAKDIADSVRLIRENFATGLEVYATQVSADNPEGYKAQLELAREAGAPITAKDSAQLSKAIAQQVADAMAEARKVKEGKGKRERQPVPA
jgi:hypothetical protein